MHPKDDILVRRTLCGDKSAFTLLVERYQGVVYRIAYRKVENHHDAEDIAQEAFLKAYCKLKTLKDPNTFPSWLYAITVNLCNLWWRKRKRQMETIELAEVAPPAPAAWQFYERQEQKAVLWDSVNALAEKDRRIMTMFYREGYSTKEIGELMGITQNQVLVRLHRARKQLKEEFIMAHKTYAIGEVQLSFIEQVMERIHHLKPTPAPSNKPLAPWLATTTLVVIALLVRLGVMQTPWFQSPYSLTSDESAVRVELTEAPIFKMPLLKQTTSKGTGLSENNGNGNGSNGSALALASNSQEGENTEEFVRIQTNGPYGGDIYSLLATPDGTLYAGTNGAGIFRSIDRGNSWTPSNIGLENYREPDPLPSVYSFAMIGDTLYAGTGGDVFRSSDGGKSWQQVTQLRRKGVSALAVMGNRKTKSSVSEANTLYVGRSEEGIIRSTDGGDSWEPVNEGLTNLRIRELAVMDTILFAGTYDGVFRLTDGGASWEPINTGLPEGRWINSFVVLGNTLYMGTTGELFCSKDKGDSWTRISSELMRSVSALAVVDTTLYAAARTGGYESVFRSADGDDSWTEVNTGLTNDVYTLLAVNGTLYAGTSGGVFRLVEGEDSWIKINNGLTNTRVDHLVFLGTTLYGLASANGIVRTVDGGKSWTTVDSSTTSTLAVSGSTLYAARVGARGGGVFRLEEGENSWTKVNSELQTIRLLIVTGKTFYACTESEGDGVFRIDAGDDSWTHLGLSDQRIKSLAVSGTKLYAGTDGGKIFRSVDGGSSWTQVNKGVKSGFIGDLVFVGKAIYAATDNGVFRSTDDGNSWTPINDIDIESPVLAVSGTTLYAGTYFGNLFRLKEGSDSWEQIESIHREIKSLAVSGNTLYAGTMFEGVFRISLKR